MGSINVRPYLQSLGPPCLPSPLELDPDILARNHRHCLTILNTLDCQPMGMRQRELSLPSSRYEQACKSETYITNEKLGWANRGCPVCVADRLVWSNLAHLLRVPGCSHRDRRYWHSNKSVHFHWRPVPTLLLCHINYDRSSVVPRRDVACQRTRDHCRNVQHFLLCRLHTSNIFRLWLSQISCRPRRP